MDNRLSENVMAARVRLPETASSLEEPQLRRIRGEYLEMPGLRLTRPQAQRLWGLDEQTCVKLLDQLVDLKFLVVGANGNYMRLAEGSPSPQPKRLAKANILARQSKSQSR
jgi:Fic family protein